MNIRGERLRLRYFVSYIFKRKGCNGPSFGHTGLIINRKIKEMDDLEKIEKDLKNHIGDDVTNVMIMNYQKF